MSKQIIISLALFFAIGPGSQLYSQPAPNSSDWKYFLENFSGWWQLTGNMDSRKLTQQCEGDWVLQEKIFRFQCKAVAPDTSGYASIYFITYNHKKHHYVFHLFDVYGGDYSETLGIGILDENRLTFNFDYPSGSFQNIFVWHQEDESWKMILRQKNDSGGWEIFAEKELRKL